MPQAISKMGSLPEQKPQRGSRAEQLIELLDIETHDCVLMPGPLNRGYVRLWYGHQQWYAHRLACWLRHGPPPTPEHHAGHEPGCSSTRCINHVRWITPAQNTEDKKLSGTYQASLANLINDPATQSRRSRKRWDNA